MSDSVRPHRQQPTRLPHPWDSPGKNTGVGCHFLLQSMKVKSESEVAQSSPTLSDPMDCSLPGSSVHGIFQARVLEWGASAFSNSLVIPRNSYQTTTYQRKQRFHCSVSYIFSVLQLDPNRVYTLHMTDMSLKYLLIYGLTSTVCSSSYLFIEELGFFILWYCSHFGLS